MRQLEELEQQMVSCLSSDVRLLHDLPTTKKDGTPLDDLAGIKIWRDGEVIATVEPSATRSLHLSPDTP